MRSPFHLAAEDYLHAGYQPIPLPYGKKSPPPSGFTGHTRLVVTDAQLDNWLHNESPSNVATVMRNGQIVIDVDGENGVRNLRSLEKEYGKLPRTWYTERGDRTRRHMYFRCRLDAVWPGELAPNVDTVQPHHRFAVLPPSIHPSGKPYIWRDPDGNRSPKYIPEADEWSELPEAWYALTERQEIIVRKQTNVDLRSWLEDNNGTGTMCAHMRQTVKEYEEQIQNGDADGFHPALRDAVWSVLGDMLGGHDGGREALEALSITVEEYMPARRTRKQVMHEWNRAVTNGIRRRAAEGERITTHLCAGGSPKDGSGRMLNFESADDIEIQAIDWLMADRIPLGEITLLVGREGSGKGMLAYHWAAEISQGRMKGHYYGKPQKVAVVAREDSWSKTISPRLIAAGANMRNILNLEVKEDGVPSALTFPRDLEGIGDAAKEAGVVLLILDPLLSVMDAQVDTYKSTDVRRVLEKFRYELECANIAAIGIMHFNKTQGTDMLSKISGSRAFSEVARAAIGVARDEAAEEDIRVMSQPRNNLGRTDLPNLAYEIRSVNLPAKGGRTANTGCLHWADMDYARTAEDALEQRVTPARAPTLSALCLESLAGSETPMSPKQVAEAIGKPRDSVRQTMKRLADNGQLDKNGYGSYSLSA
jgi:hypothetical protein